MSKLDVTDELVRRLIGEVFPLVSQLTGWDLRIDGLHESVLPKDRGYEEIVIGRLRAAGLNIDPDHHRPLWERLIERMIEANVLAAYDHGREAILVVQENVDDSNLDGLRLVIAHELVHRGQHVQHGHLFDRMDAAIREAMVNLKSENPNASVMLRLMQSTNQIMTLLESHAHFVQQEINRLHFPRGVIESHFNLGVILFRALGASKISQYTDGVPAVAGATRNGTIDALYRSLP